MSDPRVLVACPTYSGMSYALEEWAAAYHAFTYPNKRALMVDNSDGPPHGNLHYSHLIRAQGIEAIWQTVRFPFLWDTLELGWRVIVEHAWAEGCEYIFSLEADVIAPPDAIEVMLEAALENTMGTKSAVVSHRYHPRGQEGEDYWFDTLGCTLFPVAPLYVERNRVMATYEMQAFLSCTEHGHPRVRLKDKLDLKHLANPNDKLVSVFGATPAPTRYQKRMQGDPEEVNEVKLEPAALGKVAGELVPMGEEAVRERPSVCMPHGNAADEPGHGRRTLEDRQHLAKPIKTMKPEEKLAALKEHHIRLNVGCGFQQISGFVGIDFDPNVSPEVCAPIDDLPYEDSTVDEIYASHVLEHVDMDNQALEEWLRVLKPGGMLTVAVPDIVQVYYLWKHGGRWGEYNQLIDEIYINATAFGANMLADHIPEMKALYGGPGHEHKQIFLFDMLVNRVIGAGFIEVHEVVECALRPCALGEIMVQAIKPVPMSCFSDQPYCLTRRPLADEKES